MSASHAAFLRRNETGELVEAALHERIDSPYARKVDDAWLTYLAAAEAKAKSEGKAVAHLEHSHWEWELKVNESKNLLSCPTLAVECDGSPQGLMLLKTDGHFAKLAGEEGKPLVYITYLATAPWNLKTVVERPWYSGVGAVLMAAAIQVSLDAEFKGRIGLHSLPQAESFYECHGLVGFGIDPEKEHLKYFELSPEAAAKFLSRGKP